MQTSLIATPIQDVETEALVVLSFEKEDREKAELFASVNSATSGWLAEIYDTAEFTGKPLTFALLHRPAGMKSRRVLAVGAGKRDRFDAAELRKAIAAGVRHLKGKGCRSIAVALDPLWAAPEYVSAAVEGAITGDFEPSRYKTAKEEECALDSLTVVAPSTGGEWQQALDRGRILAEAQNFTRELVNEPANRMSPMVLADRARRLAEEQGLEFELLDRDRMAQLGMGALLGVAQGSEEPPALIILRYQPSTPASTNAHLGLVGKGVTFDTGGISIKPSDGMEKMKYDMAGGGAVLGAMWAIAQLKPPVPVTALIPAVENMPGGRAQRPGDIVTTLSGKTVEVLNTDAEGRLILADALTYARRLGCTHLVDAATLTGAIVVALGHVNVGVFSNDQGLLARLLSAAKAEGEKMWAMPLDDDYKEYLKSAFADIPNIGNRWGGAITAAMFLKEFVEDTPWVHLDIAGTAWLDDAKPFLAKGPSGVAVRTFVNLAMNWKA
ncbi:MAG: leucyl aminopeptidase [Bryobacteraceae bacterium]|nr:leucyl aminopeptidase [Bryobacteraceae bacterium]